MTDRRVPPHDKAAEKAILGLCILDNSKVPDIITLIDPGDLYFDKSRTIWQGIVALSCAEKEITYASLYRQLGEAVPLADISALTDGLPQSADAKYYAKIVRDKARLRRVIAAAHKLGEAGFKEDWDAARKLIDDLASQKVTSRRDRVLSEEVQRWVEATTGPFSISDCVNSCQGMTVHDRPNIRTALHRLKDRGVIEPTGKRDGVYRLIQNDCPEMDWRSAPDNEIKFILPLGLNDLVSIYGKSLIVVAGQSNQGKSAILLNMIKDNMKKFAVHYFTSEFGPSKVKKRFSLFDDVSLDDWNVKVYARAHDFADAIKPDDINIIDWLWSGTAFYEAGGDLEKIFNRLNGGVAVVALQKDPGKEYGRGGAITMDLASLYLSVFPGEVKIIKAKDWKTEENPNGKVLKLKIVHGAILRPGAEGWQYPESLEEANKALGGRGFRLRG